MKRVHMFKSLEEFWQTVHDFIAALEVSGDSPAADELKRGMSAVTGLTDGWVDFLESIEVAARQFTASNPEEYSSSGVPESVLHQHRTVLADTGTYRTNTRVSL